jgi:myo-inositol-1-phosphate synthase
MGDRTGLWLIGARGSVATTAVVGLAALRAGPVPNTGCVTERLSLDPAVFPSWQDFVLGGQDIVGTPLDKRAEELADAGVFPRSVLTSIQNELRAADAEIRSGYHPATHTGPQADAVARQVADLVEFQRAHGLARVVVINVASTEPPVPDLPEYQDLDELTRALADPARCVLTPGALAAFAAFAAGCSFVDFTPSPGLRLPALAEFARRRGVPYAGSDGKTGETLLRSVLAPMFAARRLRVLSWSGTNLLGGGDGANLADPERAAGKLASKSRGLAELLGPHVAAPLHIDHVPDLGQRKVAWDYVSFEGFLGTRMSLQFTWDGCDSSLAAPLVLDLARLVAGAHAAGESGALGALGFFFKDPLGSDEHGLAEQAGALEAWVRGLTATR